MLAQPKIQVPPRPAKAEKKTALPTRARDTEIWKKILREDDALFRALAKM